MDGGGLPPPRGARDALAALSGAGAELVVARLHRRAGVMVDGRLRLSVTPELADWLILSGAVGAQARGRRVEVYALTPAGAAMASGGGA